MQITVDKNFSACIDAVSSIIKDNTSLPILKCLQIQSAQNSLKIYATDLEFSIHCHYPYNALIPEDFSAIIPGAKFKNIIAAIGAGSEIELKSTDKYFQITSSNGEYQLATDFAFYDYPFAEAKEVLFEFDLSAQELKNALNAVEFCAGQTDFRPALNAVYFDFSDYDLNIVATNGHKLGLYALIGKCLEDTSLISKNFSVPIKFIPILRKYLPLGTVKVQVAENEVTFEVGNIKIGTRLISSAFPNYQAVIPNTSLDHSYQLDTNAIVSALRRLNAILDNQKKTSSVKFQFQDNKLILTTEMTTGNSGKEVIQLDGDYIDGMTALNIDYILKTALKITETNFELQFTDITTAVRIDTTIDGYPVIYIIMPVRL